MPLNKGTEANQTELLTYKCTLLLFYGFRMMALVRDLTIHECRLTFQITGINQRKKERKKERKKLKGKRNRK